MLVKVISGGQNGVDQAALRAAKESGIATGGWMPRGFRTLDGNRHDFREAYGMEEHTSRDYPPRTEQNVLESDVTLRIAEDFSSPGERCTLNAINRLGKPHLDISIKEILLHPEVNAVRVALWLDREKVTTLNVAGNSEHTSPGIGVTAYNFLKRVFARVGELNAVPS